MKRSLLLLSSLAWLVIGAGCHQREVENTTGPAAPAVPAPATAALQKAPNWTLPDLNGKPVHLSDYAGKVVILDFWATWCPPCREEIPGFIDLQKKYGAKGLVIIGASVDQDGPPVVRDFVAKNQINYQIVMANDDVTKAYGGIEGIPTTFVIDPAGNVVKSYMGATEESEFEAQIKPLLAQVK